MAPQLPNYLKSHRKRLALSQEEIAFLLGKQTGENVCRHERFSQEPGLETALAYEAIFKKSTRELFSGLFQKIESAVAARAKVLATKTVERKTNQRNARKLQTLTDIATAQSKKYADPS